MTDIGRWAPGTSYGPVLSQTDLYLLNAELQLNPILALQDPNFHLVFNLVTGQTGGFSNDAPERDLEFRAKDEPATLPRVSQLIILTTISPWCTIVTNERGVTMSDVCTTLWKDYTENMVTDAEFAAAPPRFQEQVKRTAQSQNQYGQPWGGQYYAPPVPSGRYRRVDWLRDKRFFEGMRRDDQYALARLGFKAPNVFVMGLTT